MRVWFGVVVMPMRVAVTLVRGPVSSDGEVVGMVVGRCDDDPAASPLLLARVGLCRLNGP